MSRDAASGSLARPLDRRAIALLAVAAAALVIYSTIRGATLTSDFKNPYRVARVLWETGALDIKGEPRYPPTIRVLLAPLAALPIGVAAGIWAVASMAAVAALPRMLERLSGVAPRDQALAWLAVLPYLIDAFALGQADPINLFLVISGLVLARDSRGVIGAGLIGIAGMLKVLPVAFWAVLAARRRLGAALAGAVATVLLSLALLTAAVGWRPALAGIAEWIQVLHEQEGPWGLVATRNSLRENNEALAIVLARTLGDLEPDLTRNAVHLAHAPLPVIWAAWLAILAVLGAIWLACARRSRASHGERAWLGLAALTAVVMLAATHIAWPHYFLWLLPAALFLADRRRLLVAIFALGQLGMMVPILRGLGIHMAIALVLFGVVARELSASPPARAQRGGP